MIEDVLEGAVRLAEGDQRLFEHRAEEGAMRR
jgi:hypothetical protein